MSRISSAIIRLPARLRSRSFTSSGSDEAPTLKRSCDRRRHFVDVLPARPRGANEALFYVLFVQHDRSHANIPPSTTVGGDYEAPSCGRFPCSNPLRLCDGRTCRARRTGIDGHDRFTDGRAEVGADGAAAARRERARGARVLPEIFRRSRVSAVLRALGRERRPGRRVRELQSLARAARAGRERRDRADVPEGSRGDDQAVHRGEDDEGWCPPASTGCTTRSSARSPTGSTTAKGCSSSTAWRSRCRQIRNISSACAGFRASTWARIPTRPTTIRSTTSSAA